MTIKKRANNRSKAGITPFDLQIEELAEEILANQHELTVRQGKLFYAGQRVGKAVQSRLETLLERAK